MQLLHDAQGRWQEAAKGQWRCSSRCCRSTGIPTSTTGLAAVFAPHLPGQCLLVLGKTRNQGGTERSRNAPAPGLSWSLQRSALAEKSFPEAATNCCSPSPGLSCPPPWGLRRFGQFSASLLLLFHSFLPALHSPGQVTASWSATSAVPQQLQAQQYDASGLSSASGEEKQKLALQRCFSRMFIQCHSEEQNLVQT